jgi:asparagine synthase (glutamine-hydrolysing)
VDIYLPTVLRYAARPDNGAESRLAFGRRPEQSLYDAANYVAAPDPLSWHRAPRDGFFLSYPFLDPDVVTAMSRLPVAGIVPAGLSEGRSP